MIGRGGGRPSRRDLVGGQHGFDLRPDAIQRDGGGDHALAVGRRQLGIDPDIAEHAAPEQWAGQAERRADLLPDRSRGQPRIDSLRAGLAVQPGAFGQVEPAVVGGQHDFVIDPEPVKHLEETGQVAVEAGKVEAHLQPAGAVGVTDIIGRRRADGDDVGGGPLAELAGQDQLRGQRQRRAVELRRCAPGLDVTGGALEPAGADSLAATDVDCFIPRRAERRRDQRRLRLRQYGGDPGVDPRHHRRRRAAGVADIGLPVPPPQFIDAVAAHHHRRAVLARDRIDAGGGERRLQPFAQRRHLQMFVGHGVGG